MLVWPSFGYGGRLLACPLQGYQDGTSPPPVCLPTLGERVTYALVSVTIGAYLFLNSPAPPMTIHWQGEGGRRAVKDATEKLDIYCECFCGKVSYVDS